VPQLCTELISQEEESYQLGKCIWLQKLADEVGIKLLLFFLSSRTPSLLFMVFVLAFSQMKMLLPLDIPS